MAESLTKIQADVLESLRRRADEGHGAPTYRDLCAEFGWSSTATARDHLRALAAKGYVRLPGARSRRVELTEDRPGVARVPVIGHVEAGHPVLSEEVVLGELPVPAAWLGRGTHFALRVRGDSMTDAGILEGDHVVVRGGGPARDGDIVIATLDGETTVKFLRSRGAQRFLVPANRRHRRIPVRTDDSVVQGVVVGLLRAYGIRPSMSAQRSATKTTSYKADSGPLTARAATSDSTVAHQPQEGFR